jgi:hypothetical protein
MAYLAADWHSNNLKGLGHEIINFLKAYITEFVLYVSAPLVLNF